MRNIEDIINDGFNISESPRRLKDLAVLSLKSALEAYFSTYQPMKHNLFLFEEGTTVEQETVDYNHSAEYMDACFQTIVRFQHFSELELKNILSQVGKVGKNGFARTVQLITGYIQSGQLDHEKYGFILNSKDVLCELNKMRNRLMHEGGFILRYPALDVFIGAFVLPISLKFVQNTTNSEVQSMWRYRSLACDIDPIAEIVKCFNEHTFDAGKIAFLKELGRAAYQTLVRKTPNMEEETKGYTRGWDALFYGDTILQSEKAAQQVRDAVSIKDCPVCGVHSLLSFEDVELEGEDHISRTFERGWRFTYKIECLCCRLELSNHLMKNPSEYGLALEDYWNVEEL